MRIDILTLFPDTVSAVLHESIIGRAAKKGAVEINCVQIRDYTENRQNQVDDYPYGGGWGCVMMAQPLKSCLESVMSNEEGEPAARERTRVIYMSPQGAVFNQETAKRYKKDYDHLVLVCGHYEGVDERFIEECVDEELSIGDFVLTGGEIAAMAVADSVCRLVPGVLSDEECYTGESHWDGLLEYPQYTRPESWEGREVPEVLLKGNHADIEKWRRKKQLERTRDKRPDMFEKFIAETPEDKALLAEMKKDILRRKITAPVTYRNASEQDLPEMLEIVAYAKKTLKAHRVDQWQGPYPEAEDFMADISRNESYVVLHGDEICAFFTLSVLPEDCYEDIKDGRWSRDGEYCVVHRIAVGEGWRGTEIAKKTLRFAEERSLQLGRDYIRIDTHRKNKAMQKLLRSEGYGYRGNLEILCEPGHDSARQGYDKILKSGRNKQ